MIELRWTKVSDGDIEHSVHVFANTKDSCWVELQYRDVVTDSIATEWKTVKFQDRE